MTLTELATLAANHPIFSRARKSADVLLFLAANSASGDQARRARIEGLKRLNGGDADTIPTVITRLQGLLDRYFATPEGRQLASAIEIDRKSKDDPRPANLYALQMKPNVVHGAFSRAFWEPHFDPEAATWIVYGEPLFMKERRDGADVFTRDVRINDRRDVAPPLAATYPFLRLGEVQCMLELARFFTEAKVPLRWYGCRRSHGLKQLMQVTGGVRTQVIVLGNTFSNGLLVAYQDYSVFPFHMDGATIRGRGAPDGGGETVFQDGTDPRYDHGFTTHGLVSRRHGFIPSTFVTTIASDNGRAIHKIGQVLCSEADLRAQLGSSKLARFQDGLPEEFQLVFKVWVHDDGDTPMHCEIVDGWTGDGALADDR
jgi:hypothetical protein